MLRCAVRCDVVQCPQSLPSYTTIPFPTLHSILASLPTCSPQEIPGVAGAPAPSPGAPAAPVEYRQFRLRRAQVALNPVFATPVHIADHVYGEAAGSWWCVEGVWRCGVSWESQCIEAALLIDCWLGMDADQAGLLPAPCTPCSYRLRAPRHLQPERCRGYAACHRPAPGAAAWCMCSCPSAPPPPTPTPTHAPHPTPRPHPPAQRDGAEAFILDLRNNPGGLVSEAMDVAALWLDGPAPIFNVQVGGWGWVGDGRKAAVVGAVFRTTSSSCMHRCCTPASQLFCLIHTLTPLSTSLSSSLVASLSPPLPLRRTATAAAPSCIAWRWRGTMRRPLPPPTRLWWSL